MSDERYTVSVDKDGKITHFKFNERKDAFSKFTYVKLNEKPTRVALFDFNAVIQLWEKKEKKHA